MKSWEVFVFDPIFKQRNLGNIPHGKSLKIFWAFFFVHHLTNMRPVKIDHSMFSKQVCIKFCCEFGWTKNKIQLLLPLFFCIFSFTCFGECGYLPSFTFCGKICLVLKISWRNLCNLFYTQFTNKDPVLLLLHLY